MDADKQADQAIVIEILALSDAPWVFQLGMVGVRDRLDGGARKCIELVIASKIVLNNVTCSSTRRQQA